MSILLGALILALLLLPGILFRLGYLSLPFSSRSFKTPFAEELIFSLLPSFLLQATGYFLVDSFICDVRERVLLLLFLNSDKAAALPIGRGDVLGFTGYALTLGLLAYLLGAGFRWISLRYKLHLKFPFLRIYSEWEIYFEGHILDYPDQAGPQRQADIVERRVDVLVQTSEGSYLYSGLLEKYVLTKDEKLDRIYLSAVRRRKLAHDRPIQSIADDEAEGGEANGEESIVDLATLEQEIESVDTGDRYYYMPGHYFMIPASEIRNIHIDYYFPDEDEDDEEEAIA